jgi:hypothetical protein
MRFRILLAGNTANNRFFVFIIFTQLSRSL